MPYCTIIGGLCVCIPRTHSGYPVRISRTYLPYVSPVRISRTYLPRGSSHADSPVPQAGLYARALQHYTDLPDIKRVIVNVHAIEPAALVRCALGGA